MSQSEIPFFNLPVSFETAARWARADKAALSAAVASIEFHGANPWVFSSDARHFWQFASLKETAALDDMSGSSREAILGFWEDEEWDPETFGYRYPSE